MLGCPHRVPTPVKLSLSDKGGEFPRTQQPHLPALQNRTYASQPVLNANIISKFFPLRSDRGQNRHGVEVL